MSIIKRYTATGWEIIGSGSNGNVDQLATLDSVETSATYLTELINTKQPIGDYVTNAGFTPRILTSSSSGSFSPSATDGDLWIDTSLEYYNTTADETIFYPYGNITAVDVQSAIEQLVNNEGSILFVGTSSTNNSIVLFDNSIGTNIKASDVTIDSSGIINNLIIKNYAEIEATVSVSSNVATIDISNGNIQKLMLNQPITAFSFPSLPSSGISETITLKIISDGSSSVSWDGVDVTWITYLGTPPTLSSQPGYIDIITFISDEVSSKWLGYIVGAEY